MSNRLSAAITARRRVLRTLALAGPLTTAAADAQIAALSTPRQSAIQPAVERRIAQLSVIRDFVFEDDSVEPALTFSAVNSSYVRRSRPL